MNIFTRPTRKAGTPQPPQRPVYPRPAPPAGTWAQPWPRVDATLTALVGLVITAFAMVSGTDSRPSQLATTAAIGVLCTLCASFAFEARGGLRNLVRADLMGVVALYYLTLYEFLFPQPYYDRNIRGDVHATYFALWAVLIGMAGLFIGRHLVPRGRQPLEDIMTRPVPRGWLLGIYWVSFFLGFLHMLLAVDFDIAEMLDAMMRARFDQPWARGRFGNWKALLNEFALLLYLLPPIAGLMLARRERYAAIHIIPVLLGFAWVLFYGFVSGTRSLFGTFLITFMISFAFASAPEKRRRIVLVSLACATAMILATPAMLEMRTMGFKRWWDGERSTGSTRQNTSVFVDDNLLAIAVLTQYFPSRNHDRYLGFEIPYLAIVRPIPRAIWPGKPKGMSISVEQIFGAKGVTIAATFAGEAYMSGGLLAVAIEALILGWLAAWWNRLASPRNSELGILIYSSGFFAVTITMRSLFALTTALLPCLAGILVGKFLLPAIRERVRPRPLVPPKLRNRPPTPPPVEP